MTPLRALHDLAPVKTLQNIPPTKPPSAGPTKPRGVHHVKATSTIATQVTVNQREEILLKPTALLRNAKLVKVGSIPANPDFQSVLVPTPPTAVKSGRPSSANRFRQMVMNYRDDT